MRRPVRPPAPRAFREPQKAAHPRRQHARAAGLLCLAALALAGRAAAADLPREIAALLASSAPAQSAFWGIQIVDLESGHTLYELNPEKLFTPASNAKLFTAAVALTRLGAAYTFQTRVLAAAGPDAAGRIRGPLILAGGGDPNLSGRALPYRADAPPGDPLAAIDDLAAQIAARGVKRVDGDIIGDDSWYVWEPYADGWAIDDPQYDFGAPVSALAVNDNALTVNVRPGARAGDLAEVAPDPALEYYGIENRIRTVAAGGARRIAFERAPGGSQIRLWGAIPLRDPGQALLVGIEDPARYAAWALREALEDRGIAVSGQAVARHQYRDEVPDLLHGAPPPDLSGVELARRVSPPLLEDLRATLKLSLNLYAEMALRAVARARRAVGSREAGLEELQAFLTEAGITPAAVSLADGSGLSRLDLVTPAAVVKLLRYMYASPSRDNWISLLPVSGEDGTLSARLGAAESGRILAKTGSMSHVAALSGYAKRPGGNLLAFSILVNNSAAPAAGIRSVMDRICTLMVE